MVSQELRRQFTGQLEWLNRFKPVQSRLGQVKYPQWKRMFDILLVVFTMPGWLPVFAICALLIKLDAPGDPVFFLQKRTGKNGMRFRMYKFRTMVPNADELKASLQHLNTLQWPDFKVDNDPRITRIGRFLRATSLDELPQIINVLRGEMTLVGPRPTSFAPDTYRLWHTERLEVVPGLTGLWQICGRGNIEFDDRLRLDIAYIERCCLWIDLQILFRTFGCVVNKAGK